MPYLIVNDMAYQISKYIIPPIYLMWLREVDGLENVPKDKPFIIAVNHTSYYDALLLPCILGPKINKQFHAWVNSFYWRYPMTRFFLNLWGGIPMYVEKEKGSKKKNKAAFKQSIKFLRKGDVVMIFPEGRRSDGKLLKAYPGIARLALTAKVPVLPIGIIGANKVIPKGVTFPRFARCDVKIGKLLHFDSFYKKNDEKTFEQVTRSIMKEIAKLIGQKYNY